MTLVIQNKTDLLTNIDQHLQFNINLWLVFIEIMYVSDASLHSKDQLNDTLCTKYTLVNSFQSEI